VSFRRSVLPFAAVLGLVLWTAAGAAAVPLTAVGWDPVDGPAPVEAEPHPGGPGHLPPGSRNMALVGKVQLTNVDGGIADVAAFGNYAYLNAFSPECTGRPGAQGTGVHIVNISNPAAPVKVGFIPAHANSYLGEGIHVVRAKTPWFEGDMLIHNNETCNATAFTPSGASLWNVTNPNSPVALKLNFGDTDPAVALQTYHTTHSAQLFVQRGVQPDGTDRILAFLQDNQDLEDVDIFDVSNPAAPVLLSEQGLEDWPGAQGSYANGDTVFHHDMQGKRIGGVDYLLVSYWDAGQVLLDIDDPANPVFVGDSDYRVPDPLMPQFEIPEGNSHQSYWDADNEFIISTDEDFSPYRTLFEMTDGPNAGEYGAGEFGFTPSIESQPDGTIAGPTVFGGRGCLAAGPNAGPDAVVGEPSPPLASAISAAPGEEKTVVFTRGGCFFSTKIAAGQDLGYDAVIIGQSHGGSRNGLLPDGFFCGGQGHDYDEQAPAICIGQRGTHLMFNDTPEYTGPEGTDIPVGTLGARYTASTEFDGWGYVQLHDARDANLRILDSYAIPEALDESFTTEDHGILSVHEVKTDPRANVNLAYISYYNAGARVVKFNAKQGLREVGFYIPEGGVHFWGTFPHRLGKSQGAPLLLFSDRDSGLYILRYTG
jgi:LVIVD repeat-containing protein